MNCLGLGTILPTAADLRREAIEWENECRRMEEYGDAHLPDARKDKRVGETRYFAQELADIDNARWDRQIKGNGNSLPYPSFNYTKGTL